MLNLAVYFCKLVMADEECTKFFMQDQILLVHTSKQTGKTKSVTVTCYLEKSRKDFQDCIICSSHGASL